MEGFLDFLIGIVNSTGYFGIFISVCFEYACFPISSEILLPFIGYTVAKGELKILPAIAVSVLGGVSGSVICYFCGRFLSNFLENVICKRFSGFSKGFHRAKEYFNKSGHFSVFLGRLFPIVRTYISIPAGISGMNIWKFIALTALGACLWNTFLILAGYFLG